jgi:hypothetical protein
MKIVNRKEFLKLPAGIVFAKYKPCIFGKLAIKESSIDCESINDFIVQPLGVEIDADFDEFVGKCKKAENGEEVPLNYDCFERDGFFHQDQLFAVFSKEDVKKLIDRLIETL